MGHHADITAVPKPPHSYEPPTLIDLGTLEQLTQGGITAVTDTLAVGSL